MVDIESLRDPEQLRNVCRAYEASHRMLARQIRDLTNEIARLKGLDPDQAALSLPELEIFPAETEADPEPEKPAKKPRKPQKGHGPKPQPRLPIEFVDHHFDRVPQCPCCGEAPRLWNGQYEQSEEITVVETQFKIKVHRRAKYVCGCHGAVLTAPGPPKLIPGGRYSVEFACHSATEKFCDHIPLERQCRRNARKGLDVGSNTLWDQHRALAEWLEPTWRALNEMALDENVLHVDETGWKMMASKKPKWTLFGLTTPNLAVYHLSHSKTAAQTQKILSGFRGTLVVDGLKVYPVVAKLENQDEERIRIAHCWFHADRKFKDAKDPPKVISEFRSRIAKLYEIEREVEGPFPGNEAAQKKRHALRQKKSRPLLEEMRKLAFEQGGLRRSNFGKALQYMLNHWGGLTLFLEDPRIPLDNNPAERVLRGPVVGRKNFYGNRSKRGAHTTAILYSLIETAKLNELDPSEYLRKAALAAIAEPGTVTLPFELP